MSKNTKIVLMVVGILVFLVVACVGGLTIAGYFFVDNKAIDKSTKEGRAFGQTTDNLGCQTKIVSMIPSLNNKDYNGILEVQYFFDSCLEASRPTPNFCDGVANPFGDIFNDDEAKDAECEKLGLKDSINCRLIIEKKLDFCMNKK